MKFYLIKYEAENPQKYARAYIFENSLWKDEPLFAGEYKAKHELPIPYYVENKIKPNDFVFAKNIVVSGSFLKVISQVNKDYEALESQFYYLGKNSNAFLESSGNESGIIWDLFYTMIFPGYELLNEEASDCEYIYIESLGKQLIRSINTLVLSSEKINSTVFENNIFLLKEKKSYLLCTDNAKQAIEEAGLIGIGFKEVPVV